MQDYDMENAIAAQVSFSISPPATDFQQMPNKAPCDFPHCFKPP
jgi:hypothetical protein